MRIAVEFGVATKLSGKRGRNFAAARSPTSPPPDYKVSSAPFWAPKFRGTSWPSGAGYFGRSAHKSAVSALARKLAIFFRKSANSRVLCCAVVFALGVESRSVCEAKCLSGARARTADEFGIATQNLLEGG